MVDLLTVLLKEKKKNLYCFGAGRMFDDFIKEFSTYNLKENIKAIVDNRSNMINPPIKEVQSAEIPIISFVKMLENIKDNDRILITTAAYEEIVEQIESVVALKNINYYIYPVLRIERYDCDRLNIAIPLKTAYCRSTQIPKIIHYCWFGEKEIPEQYRKWMESWRKYCPDYEIIEWNEKNYDVHKNKYIDEAYEKGEWAFVSDYARIDIINEYGGIYLDADVELIKNIDELLKNHAFCGFESNEYVNYGLGFGSKRNNSILAEIKIYYENKNFIQKNGILNRTSCPFIQTEIMKRHGLRCNGEFQIVDEMSVFPSRVLCGMSPHSFRIEKSLVHTYAIHHFSGSWVKDKREKNNIILAMKKWSKNDNYIYSDI